MNRASSLFLGIVLIAARAAWPGAAVLAQEHHHPAPPAQPPELADPADHAQHADHRVGASTLFPAREASGTAWLPELAPMHAVHTQAGRWELMLHGRAFAQFLYEAAEDHRGAHQVGSINWVMGMARRPAGAGFLGLRGMLSLEPWTIPGCGYPDLLATGEICDGDTIHDRQHPHDLFMEIAAEYDQPIGRSLRLRLYGGPAGEPALGPAGFPHRPSAAPNAIAPIAHHWLDATHITFGVVTAGLYGERWKADASVFNGREPDEMRTDVDLAPLDSYSARITVMPARAVTLQVSAGRLKEAEAHPGLTPADVTRATASAAWHRELAGAGIWATTLAWGVNAEGRTPATHAILLESSATLKRGHIAFGRLEMVGKSAHDLHVHESSGTFTVAKLQLGYSRDLPPRGGVQAGVGGSVSASIVPAALGPRYGGRVAPGLGVFFTVQPAAHAM